MVNRAPITKTVYFKFPDGAVYAVPGVDIALHHAMQQGVDELDAMEYAMTEGTNFFDTDQQLEDYARSIEWGQLVKISQLVTPPNTNRQDQLLTARGTVR